jgi:hypothetical protein
MRESQEVAGIISAPHYGHQARAHVDESTLFWLIEESILGIETRSFFRADNDGILTCVKGQRCLGPD